MTGLRSTPTLIQSFKRTATVLRVAACFGTIVPSATPFISQSSRRYSEGKETTKFIKPPKRFPGEITERDISESLIAFESKLSYVCRLNELTAKSVAEPNERIASLNKNRQHKEAKAVFEEATAMIERNRRFVQQQTGEVIELGARCMVRCDLFSQQGGASETVLKRVKDARQKVWKSKLPWGGFRDGTIKPGYNRFGLGFVLGSGITTLLGLGFAHEQNWSGQKILDGMTAS